MLSFSRDPKGYVQDLLRSQSRDLKVKRGLREHWHQDKHMEGKGGHATQAGEVLGNSGQTSCFPRQVMTDVAGNPEEERRAEFYHQPWSQEAVSRYFYCKVMEALEHEASLSSSPSESLLLAFQ